MVVMLRAVRPVSCCGWQRDAPVCGQRAAWGRRVVKLQGGGGGGCLGVKAVAVVHNYGVGRARARMVAGGSAGLACRGLLCGGPRTSVTLPGGPAYMDTMRRPCSARVQCDVACHRGAFPAFDSLPGRGSQTPVTIDRWKGLQYRLIDAAPRGNDPHDPQPPST